MPPLKKHKAEFHGLTDLGAGASRVLPQTHSQVCVRRAGRARPGLGSGWAGLGPSGQSHPGSLATRVPPAVPLKASPGLLCHQPCALSSTRPFSEMLPSPKCGPGSCLLLSSGKGLGACSPAPWLPSPARPCTKVEGLPGNGHTS